MTGIGSSLMWVKVLLLLAALALFVWWQFRDLAMARKERERGASLVVDKPSEESPSN